MPPYHQVACMTVFHIFTTSKFSTSLIHLLHHLCYNSAAVKFIYQANFALFDKSTKIGTHVDFHQINNFGYGSTLKYPHGNRLKMAACTINNLNHRMEIPCSRISRYLLLSTMVICTQIGQYSDEEGELDTSAAKRTIVTRSL